MFSVQTCKSNAGAMGDCGAEISVSLILDSLPLGCRESCTPWGLDVKRMQQSVGSSLGSLSVGIVMYEGATELF